MAFIFWPASHHLLRAGITGAHHHFWFMQGSVHPRQTLLSVELRLAFLSCWLPALHQGLRSLWTSPDLFTAGFLFPVPWTTCLCSQTWEWWTYRIGGRKEDEGRTSILWDIFCGSSCGPQLKDVVWGWVACQHALPCRSQQSSPLHLFPGLKTGTDHTCPWSLSLPTRPPASRIGRTFADELSFSGFDENSDGYTQSPSILESKGVAQMEVSAPKQAYGSRVCGEDSCFCHSKLPNQFTSYCIIWAIENQHDSWIIKKQ